MSEALHIFSPQDIDYNKNWGSFRYDWSFVESHKLTISFFCNIADGSRIRIYGDKNFLLAEFKHSSDSGLNYLEYDLTTAEKQFKKYFKENKKTKAADNGKYYLKPGKYTIEILHGQTNQTAAFEIKEQQKKSRKKKKKTP